LTERAGEEALADAAWAGEQQVASGADPVARAELEEQAAVEAARGLIVDVLETRVMAETGSFGPVLKPLLTPEGDLLIEQQAEPFSMIERAGFGLSVETLEAPGHAGEAEFVEKIERWMKQHIAMSLVQWK
jgi:hypothetical protein